MKKVWMVTGASRGIGLALCRFLLDAGRSVVATARNPDDLHKKLRQNGERFLILPLDITDQAQVDEVVDKLEELQVVRACYDQWCRLQGEVESCYHDKPREKKSCPRRRSSGRSRTPSFRRRNAFGWRRSPSRMMTWLSAMSRNRCRASPLPAGNYGKSSGTRPFL